MKIINGLLNIIKGNFTKQKGGNRLLIGTLVLFCLAVAVVEIIKVALR